MEVSVAVTPPFTPVFEVLGDETPRYDAPWADLPNVTFEVDDASTLRDVLRLACDRLGVRLTADVVASESRYRREEGLPPASEHPADKLVYLDFWQPGDDDVVDGSSDPVILRRNTRRPALKVVVRDADGQAVWRTPGLDASMAELVDAAAVGLVEGNPLRPYLHPSIPQGDFGALGEWVTFGNALKAIGGAYVGAGILSTVEGTMQLRDRLRSRGKQVVDAAGTIGTLSPDWTTRGAAPADLLRLLARRPRTTPEVANLLGCSGAEAESLLWGLGFQFDSDEGRWIHAGDEVARLLVDDIDMSFSDAVAVLADEEVLEHVVMVRVAEFLASGSAPDPAAARQALQKRLLDDLDSYEAKAGRAASVRRVLQRAARRGRR